MSLTVDHPTLAVARVRIQDADEALIEACVRVGTQNRDRAEFNHLLVTMLARRTQPVVIDLLVDESGAAGWVGFVPYAEAPASWESTTFLAPRLRGTGLLAQARCWQAHMVDELLTQHTDVRVLSSIAEWNEQSQRASRRYATEHDWPDTWHAKFEPHKARTSLILDWPLPVPHTCFAENDALCELTAGAA